MTVYFQLVHCLKKKKMCVVMINIILNTELNVHSFLLSFPFLLVIAADKLQET